MLASGPESPDASKGELPGSPIDNEVTRAAAAAAAAATATVVVDEVDDFIERRIGVDVVLPPIRKSENKN